MRTEHGRILAVTQEYLGSEVVGDYLAGVTSLVVEDATDFNENGGVLVLNDAQVAYTAVDEDTKTLTLATPLPADAVDGDTIKLWDGTQVVGDLVALVALDDMDDDADAVEAAIAQPLLPVISEGIRDGDEESVAIELDDAGEWTVVDSRPYSVGWNITGPIRTSSSGARAELTDEATGDAEWGDQDSGASLTLWSSTGVGYPAKLNYRVSGGWAYTLLQAGGYAGSQPYIEMVDDNGIDPRIEVNAANLTLDGRITLGGGGLAQYMQSGRVTITPSGASVNTTVSITFPTTMAAIPNVSLGLGTGVSSDLYCVAWANQTSTTGFQLTLRRGNTTATTIMWTAIVPQ